MVTREFDPRHPGTVIVVDNVIRGAKVLTESDDVRVAATRGTLQLKGEHPRLDAAALQTVGGKEWDGFAITLVRCARRRVECVPTTSSV